MVVTLNGMSIFVRLEQLLNALLPMLVTPVLRMTVLILLLYLYQGVSVSFV